MNKSRVARDLWRKVFNDNIINLSDSDARKQVVADFLKDPVNIKAGWKKKDARFMRLGFQKVAKENNFNGALPTTPQLEGQQAQATQYSAQSVGQIFNTLFNIISARTGCSPLSQNEIIALGEAWSPLFNIYFTGHSLWVMPVVISAPILLSRVAEISKLKKEKEVKERYGMEDAPPKEEVKKQKSNWEDMSFGKNKTNKR